jgi:hypothetical protein
LNLIEVTISCDDAIINSDKFQKDQKGEYFITSFKSADVIENTLIQARINDELMEYAKKKKFSFPNTIKENSHFIKLLKSEGVYPLKNT